jgi:hypothetical protein
MYKNGFGQAQCIDLVKRIPTNFTSQFFDISTNFEEFLKFITISVD